MRESSSICPLVCLRRSSASEEQKKEWKCPLSVFIAVFMLTYMVSLSPSTGLRCLDELVRTKHTFLPDALVDMSA